MVRLRISFARPTRRLRAVRVQGWPAKSQLSGKLASPGREGDAVHLVLLEDSSFQMLWMLRYIDNDSAR